MADAFYVVRVRAVVARTHIILGLLFRPMCSHLWDAPGIGVVCVPLWVFRWADRLRECVSARYAQPTRVEMHRAGITILIPIPGYSKKSES